MVSNVFFIRVGILSWVNTIHIKSFCFLGKKYLIVVIYNRLFTNSSLFTNKTGTLDPTKIPLIKRSQSHNNPLSCFYATLAFFAVLTHVINRYKVTHVPSTSLNSNISLTSSTCFFHEQSPPASPFSRAMAEKHGNDRRWRRERWRSPEISPAFPRCASCSVRRSSPAVRAVTAQTRRTRMSRALVSPKRLGST